MLRFLWLPLGLNGSHNVQMSQSQLGIIWEKIARILLGDQMTISIMLVTQASLVNLYFVKLVKRLLRSLKSLYLNLNFAKLIFKYDSISRMLKRQLSLGSMVFQSMIQSPSQIRI